jgi:hypothetical protein
MLRILEPIPLILAAHCVQEPAEVLHMGFACGIADYGGTICKGSSHDGILGGSHRSFVQEDIGTLELVGGEDEGTIDLYPCAKFFKRQQMGIKAPPAYHIAAWWRQDHLAEPGQKRAGKQDGCPDLGSQVCGNIDTLVTPDILAADAPVIAAQTLHPAPIAEQMSIMTRTSSISGILRRITGSSDIRAAAIQGRAAFLLPLARMVPFTGWPPSILYWYMGISYTAVWKWSTRIPSFSHPAMLATSRKRSLIVD